MFFLPVFNDGFSRFFEKTSYMILYILLIVLCVFMISKNFHWLVTGYFIYGLSVFLISSPYILYLYLTPDEF